MGRPAPLTIPERSNFEPDITPPAPTSCEIPAHLRNISKKRGATRDSENDAETPTSEENTWDSTTPEHEDDDSEPAPIPSAPVCRVYRSVKRPRSMHAVAVENENVRHSTLASLLDSISLANESIELTDSLDTTKEVLDAECSGTSPLPLNRSMKSYSWSAGEGLKIWSQQRVIERVGPLHKTWGHVIGRVVDGLSHHRLAGPISPGDGKRRRSITAYGAGAHIGGHLTGTSRSKQLRGGRCLAPPGCPSPFDCSNLDTSTEVLLDWPPNAGDTPAWRKVPGQAEVLSPGRCVREAMRAQLRKRLSIDSAGKSFTLPLPKRSLQVRCNLLPAEALSQLRMANSTPATFE